MDKAIECNMKDITLVVCDMDGTLLNDKQELDANIHSMIERLNQKKILFTLATGRNIHIVRPYLEQLKLSLPIICNNGANVYDSEGKCIKQYSIDPKDVQYALKQCELFHAACIVYTTDAIYYDENPKLDAFARRLKGKVHAYSLEQFPLHSTDVMKMVVIHSYEEGMDDLMKTINHGCTYAHLVRSEGDVHTFSSKDATKGKALSYICEKLSIPMEQTLVFGDNYNDISMFKQAGYSVAMVNAETLVKKYATFISDEDNNHQGVSKFILDRIK